jgi:hypothetical protein
MGEQEAPVSANIGQDFSSPVAVSGPCLGEATSLRVFPCKWQLPFKGFQVGLASADRGGLQDQYLLLCDRPRPHSGPADGIEPLGSAISGL